MDNALVVNLSISMWAGHKLDKAKTSEVNHNANAASDASRVNKHLVSKTSMADIVRCAGALRQYVYRATLPWGDNGDRLIGASGYMAFVDEFAKLKQQFDEAVEDFIAVRYPAEKARAQFRMGDMFVPEDYPEPETLRRKFAVILDVHGVPSATDLRAQLREEDIQHLRRRSRTTTSTSCALPCRHCGSGCSIRSHTLPTGCRRTRSSRTPLCATCTA